MKPGDYTVRERITADGRTVKEKIVVSSTGVSYAVGKRIGRGGLASCYKSVRVHDGYPCVIKIFEADALRTKVHRAIEKNIKKLMKKPVTHPDGTPLNELIGPLDKDSFIPLPASQGFAYIMREVDTKKYKKISELRRSKTDYPDIDILLNACKKIAYVLYCIHQKGMAYRDLNNDNVFIDPETGDIRIIDCDNISESGKTIDGTFGFIAPEVYQTRNPDIFSDYYQIAVLYYLLFVGGNPLYGKKTEKYLKHYGVSEQEAAEKIYGPDMALFAFDPKDDSNTLSGCVDPRNPHLYKIQIKNWERIPPGMKTLFIKTFATGLKNPEKRAKDEEWIHVYENLLADTVRCRNRACRRVNFPYHKGNDTCIYCGSRLPHTNESSLSDALETGLHPSSFREDSGKNTESQTTASADEAGKKLVFQIARDISTKPIIFEVTKNQTFTSSVYPGLPKTWIKILHKVSTNELAAVNKTNKVWQIHYHEQSFQCRFGQAFILKKGMCITILPGKLDLQVIET